MSSTVSKEPRRFAPLGEVEGEQHTFKAPRLKGIVFDVDGTLCLPQNYMFAQMRSALSIQKPTDILEHVYSLEPTAQALAFEKIRAIKRTGMTSQQPQAGLLPLMEYLESRSVPKAICTRNFDAPVNHLLTKFLEGKHFDPIITREFSLCKPKPSPEGIHFIAKSWGFVKKEEEKEEGDAGSLIMVGDSLDDMTAGYTAGAATVLLVNEVNAHLANHQHTDLCISRLDELIEILERGFVGQIASNEEDDEAVKSRAEEVLQEGKGESNG